MQQGDRIAEGKPSHLPLQTTFAFTETNEVAEEEGSSPGGGWCI